MVKIESRANPRHRALPYPPALQAVGELGALIPPDQFARRLQGRRVRFRPVVGAGAASSENYSLLNNSPARASVFSSFAKQTRTTLSCLGSV